MLLVRFLFLYHILRPGIDLIIPFHYAAGGRFKKRCIIKTDGTLKSIDMFDTSSGGNAVDYGELSDEKYSGAFGGATQTRGVFGGGSVPSSPNGTNSIDFISLQSSGDSQDFGDLATVSGTFLNCCSDSHGGLGGF